MQRASASYTFGRFHLDVAERRLSRDGTAIPLTPKAFDTLLTLVQNGGHALTKDELMRAVWPDGFVEEVNLAYNISILRKALADGQPGTSYIETIPKLGYRFVAAVQAKGPSSLSSPTHTTIDGTFGDLLSQHLHRKHGLSQSKLASGILQSPAVISKMCKGQRLTGPQARERVLAIIGWLRQQGALETVAEANALLTAAGMASLRQAEPVEFTLIRQLHTSPAEPHVTLPVVRRTNLPAQLTRFIGRDRELAEVVRVVNEKRLVTLTGAAGMGKTRLALEVACQMSDFSDPTGAFRKSDSFEGGVWLAELAPLADGALVPSAIASIFGLSEQPGRPLVEALIAFIAEKHLLLILDNCEHVIEASARLAETLVRSCTKLRILATSREALRLAGEVTWHVPPLSMPDSANLPSLECMAEYDAVQLFVEHAALTQLGFTLTPANMPAVAHICNQLDGMPLALEMAAAQVADMGPAGVASGLDDRFALLVNGSRTAVPRHQTLRATLDWSYALLSEPERALLARLSVFAGGWTADAAQAVCGAEALPYLRQLVRKSLVLSNLLEGQIRYHLLESVRQYAVEKLHARGESDVTRHRHLAYFLAIAEEPIELAGPRVDAWVRRMDPEYDNLRVAFTWSMACDDGGEQAMRLVYAMATYAFRRGHVVEIQTWIDQATSRSNKAPAFVRARALKAKAANLILQGAITQALRYAEEALALFLQTDDRLGLAWCLELLANNQFNERAHAFAEEALSLFRELGSRDGEGRALRALGVAAYRAGDHTLAATLLEQSIAVAPWDIASCVWHLYHVNPKRALALCEQEQARLAKTSEKELSAALMETYGALLMAEGEYERAGQMLTALIQLERSGAAPPMWGLVCFAMLAVGFSEQALHHTDRAVAWWDEARQLSSESRITLTDISAQFLKTSVLIAEENLDVTLRNALECLRGFIKLDFQPWMVCSLILFADIACRQGQTRRASILLGAAGTFTHEIDKPSFWLDGVPGLWQRHAQHAIIAPTLAAARAALGDAEFEAAYAEGQRMTLEQAVEYALAIQTQTSTPINLGASST
jgi:predicted ATPase/DNA-binding winged helix-turn-helix (wHTH) protein